MPCIRNALLKGYIAAPVLAPRIVQARDRWLDWHHDFAANQLPALIAEDQELARRVEAMDSKAEIVILNPADTALQVLSLQEAMMHPKQTGQRLHTHVRGLCILMLRLCCHQEKPPVEASISSTCGTI